MTAPLENKSYWPILISQEVSSRPAFCDHCYKNRLREITWALVLNLRHDWEIPCFVSLLTDQNAFSPFQSMVDDPRIYFQLCAREVDVFHSIWIKLPHMRSVVMSPNAYEVICWAKAPVATTLYGMCVAIVTPHPLLLERDCIEWCNFSMCFTVFLFLSLTHSFSSSQLMPAFFPSSCPSF